MNGEIYNTHNIEALQLLQCRSLLVLGELRIVHVVAYAFTLLCVDIDFTVMPLAV